MNMSGTAGRLLVGLAVVALVGGCAGGATPSVKTTTNVSYETESPLGVPGVLDAYAPAEAGPWPVVVMFHGAGGSKGDLGKHARRVADLGFVVFSATWGAGMDASAYTDEQARAIEAQGACAIAFARAHAAEYGGDPATMIVFGHSGGANTAAMVAFARPEPTAGCLGGTTLGAIDALVTWEGNWILSAPRGVHDPAVAADPRVLDALTPWKHLAEHSDLEVVILVSEFPNGGDMNFDRELGDPWAADSWLAVRDPSGDLRRQLEANGAFADGTLDLAEVQQLLYSVLEANGNPVSLDVMPGSSHIHLSDAGWKVFLAAFPKAAAKS
jgi:acetyl esterase/lipase